VETETKNTIPLWLAVAITVCVSLPFGIWLDKYNLPLWAAFIVWAQYFAMGGKPSVLKTVVPAYVIGVIGAALIMTAYMLLSTNTGAGTIFSIGDWSLTNDNVALFAACLVGFCILIYAMKWMPVTLAGMTPFFNGISMLLGVFFTAAFVKPFPADLDPVLLPAAAAVGAILAGILGAALGWFNVVIMFPHPVVPASVARQHPAGV
jgi:hypothetical protein